MLRYWNWTKLFAEYSDKHREQRTESTRSQHTVEALLFAAEINSGVAGNPPL